MLTGHLFKMREMNFVHLAEKQIQCSSPFSFLRFMDILHAPAICNPSLLVKPTQNMYDERILLMFV